MAGPFELSLQQFAEKAGARADQAVREVVLEVLSRVKIRSPVDTGRFRNSWFVSDTLGSVVTVTKIGKAVSSFGPPPEVVLAGKIVGRSFYIQNPMPYGRRLEYGWSKQAPAGMVRLTVAEFSNIVDQAVAKVSR